MTFFTLGLPGYQYGTQGRGVAFDGFARVLWIKEFGQ
jgi:hypothetical protein